MIGNIKKNHAYKFTFSVALLAGGGLATLCCGPNTPEPLPPIPWIASTGGAHDPWETLETAGAGGATTETVTARPAFPQCETDTTRLSLMKSLPVRKFGPAMQPRSKSALATMAADPVTGDDVWWTPNDKGSLDQGNVGLCTGASVDGVLSTYPYDRHMSLSDAIALYSAATRLDRGCQITDDTCRGAYPPTDNGSYATSTMSVALRWGWVRGVRQIEQSPQGWHDALMSGPCAFDQNWYSSGNVTDLCGATSVTGDLQGGHSTEALGFDVLNQRMWLRNSWGDSWGVGGGFYYYTVSDLYRLFFSGAYMVCPMVPAAS